MALRSTEVAGAIEPRSLPASKDGTASDTMALASPRSPRSDSEPNGAPVTTRSPSDEASASVQASDTPPFSFTNIGVGGTPANRAHRRLLLTG